MARQVRPIVRALLAGGISVGLAAPALAGAAAPRVQLRAFVCQPARQPASRAISVTSVMRPVSGTVGFEVRFDLLSRAGRATSFTAVSGRDLGRWLTPANRTLGSRPGDVWIFNKPVVGLPAPAAYRFRVRFRWIGRGHHVLGEVQRTTATCHQPELRPDLVVKRIGAPVPNRKGTFDFYTVTIANRGATAAGPFTVGLAPPGGTTTTAKLAGLAPHTTARVTLRGPLCAAGAPPVATADLYSQVDDFDRTNNVAAASCTAATTPF